MCNGDESGDVGDAVQDTKVELVVVGCGVPEISIGAYHIQQFLSDFSEDCTLTGVVEPWFLGPLGSSAPGSAEFRDFQESVNQQVSSSSGCELEWVDSVEALAPRPLKLGSSALAVIACRTDNMPDVACQVMAKGFSHVYLEKPGASSMKGLQQILAEAEARGVVVNLGYNKNVSSYVDGALSHLRRCQIPTSDGSFDPSSLRVVLEHNNSFPLPQDDTELLDFIRGAGSEGIVHNMMCHELALAHTFLGLTDRTLDRVEVSPESNVLRVDGRIDFQRLILRCHLVDGSCLEFIADRCAGNYCSVHIDQKGVPRESFSMPDEEHARWVEEQQKARPKMRGYLLLQQPDYLELKRRVLKQIRTGCEGVPSGVVTLDGARQVLILADVLAREVQQQAALMFEAVADN
jgi:predicted dehydrogenase